MNRLQKSIFYLLTFGICGVGLIASSDLNLPGNNEGYAPEQPIDYSHRLHAGELQIDCMYCHFGARSSRHAGIPSASICMNCHRNVTASKDALQQERLLASKEGREPTRIISSELRKLYDAMGLDDNLDPDPDKAPYPIPWIRVHNMPDFVYFDHRPHVARGFACETCHGPVQTMERIRQEEDLSMGWCLDCHRKYDKDASSLLGTPNPGQQRVSHHVSTDCASCHF